MLKGYDLGFTLCDDHIFETLTTRTMIVCEGECLAVRLGNFSDDCVAPFH